MKSLLHYLGGDRYLKVEVYYDKGGLCEWSGLMLPRGIFIKVTPIQKVHGHERLILQQKLYLNILLKETKRKDTKLLSIAENHLYKLAQLPGKILDEYLTSEPLLKEWFNLETKSLYDSSSLLG